MIAGGLTINVESVGAIEFAADMRGPDLAPQRSDATVERWAPAP